MTPLEWLDSNRKRAFPFVNKPVSPVGLETVILDMQIVLDQAPIDGRLIMFFLAHNNNPLNWSAQVQITDEDFNPVFDAQLPGTAFRGDNFGPFTIWTWIRGKNFVRMVVDRVPAANYQAVSAYSAILVDRVIDYRPKRVNKIRVKNLVNPGPVAIVEGQPSFVAGYNIDMALDRSRTPVAFFDTPPATQRTRNRILLNAVPGAGAGTFPNCDESAAFISRISNVGPNGSGNFSFSADECMWWERPGNNSGSNVVLSTNSGSPNIMKLNQDCYPCCDCEDYWSMYELMRAQWERMVALFGRLLVLRDKYEEVRQQWLDAQATQCDEIVRAIRVFPKPGWQIGVHLLVQNPKNCDMPNVRIDAISVTAGAGWNWNVIPKTSYILSGGRDVAPWNPMVNMTNPGPTINAGRLMLWTCELYFHKPRNTSQVITISAPLYLNGIASGTLSTTTQLVEPFNK